MTALVPNPARRARAWDEGLVVRAGADLAHLLPDVPGAEARVLVELVEPVRRGTARPARPGSADRVGPRAPAAGPPHGVARPVRSAGRRAYVAARHVAAKHVDAKHVDAAGLQVHRFYARRRAAA
ncbi:hypothetical protein [Saccharothrix sp. HUAS TT1]|uniref:hypothetical protein n=1 Tax=unclassified Saccharothrix TaxID=2593673 RepID=UPI00345B7F9B